MLVKQAETTVFHDSQTKVFSSSGPICSITMGIKFSRKRDAPANSAEAAAEPASARPEEPENRPGSSPARGAEDKQDLDVVVAKPASPVASLPKEDCVWQSREVKEEEEDDPSAPVDPAAGAQACSALPEAATNPAGLPVDPEPASETGHKNSVTIETIPDPVTSSPTLDELGGPAPGPDPTPASVDPDDEFPDKQEVPSEPLGELVEAEFGGSSQGVRNDVDLGGVGKLLEDLELTGRAPTADTDPCDDMST